MRIAILVVGKLATRRCLANLLDIDLLPRLRDGGRDLERRERRTGIATCGDDDGVERVIGNLVFIGKATLVLERTLDEHLDAVIADGLELDDARTGDERGIDLEEGILRRRANQDYDAIFDGVQQGILLRAREAVNLVDEEDGATLEGKEPLLCRLDLASQVCHRTRDGRDLDKGGVRGIGDDMRDGCLARARRPEENDRGKRVVGDRASEPRCPCQPHLPGRRSR